MKKLFSAFVFIVVSAMVADAAEQAIAANDVVIFQRDGTNSSNILNYISTSSSGVLMLDANVHAPVSAPLDTGLIYTGGKIKVSNIPITSITGLSAYYLASNPTNYISRSGITAGTGINYDNSTGIVTNSRIAPTFTDLTGSTISITKFASGIVTPNTGNGYSIDISGVGLSSLLGYSIEPIKSTATATSVPKIAIKSSSNTAIVVNVIEGNATTVNILGNLVLLGASETFVNVSGLTLNVTVWGN